MLSQNTPDLWVRKGSTCFYFPDQRGQVISLRHIITQWKTNSSAVILNVGGAERSTRCFSKWTPMPRPHSRSIPSEPPRVGLRHLSFFKVSLPSQQASRVEKFALANEVLRLLWIELSIWIIHMNYHFPFLKPHSVVLGSKELIRVKGLTIVPGSQDTLQRGNYHHYHHHHHEGHSQIIWLELLFNCEVVKCGSWHF